jgi:hypothetical protein
MGESLTAMYLQNPELANAIRRRQSGMAMMQQGTDASPIQSPYQGLSRLAQALLGGYEARKGDEEIKGVGERSAAEVADFSKRMGAMLGGGGMGAQPPAVVPVPGVPGATQTPLAAPQSGASMPPRGSSDLIGLVAPIAQKYGVPIDLAMALIQQESGGNPNAVGDGGQSVGLGQIQARTAQQPGYGVPPMDPARRTDPAANVDFALNYLTSKGRALGATDFSNPDHVDRALLAYNGGGDPNYIANVRGRMGGTVTPVQAPAQDAPQGAPVTPGMGNIPPAQMRALAMEAANSRNPRIQAMAPMLMQMATAEGRTTTLAPGAELLDPSTGRVIARNTTPSPNTVITNDMRGPGAYDADRGKTFAARATGWEDADKNAAQKLRTIERFTKALENVETGFGSQASITAGQIADRLNVPEATLRALGMTREQTASREQIRSMAAGMVLESLGAGGFPAAGFSNADRDFLERMKPGLINSKEGNLALLKVEAESAKRQRAIGAAWREWRRTNGDNPDSVRRFEDEKLPGLEAPEGTAQRILEDSGWQATPTSAPGADDGTASEGRTATNPQTGQKLIFQGGQWRSAQ